MLLLAAGVCAAGAPPAEPQTNLRRTFVVGVFEANRLSVVNVNTTQIVRQRFGLFGDDPFFRDFFALGVIERDVKRASLGSGFIVHGEGYIVTNAHVVDAADEVEVILATGEHLPASVLASDSKHDLAILKVEPPQGLELRPVELGDAADLIIGEPVVAIGNPLGYGHTVTAGIVSAANRSLPVAQGLSLEGLIQTDTAINPGNSGGPLLNAYGQLIGITTAIRGDAQNIGFAIPVHRLRDLIPELLSPLLHNGVDLGGRITETRRIDPPSTVRAVLNWIDSEAPSTPLPIMAVQGHPCRTIIEAYVELLRLRPGDRLELTTRSGEKLLRPIRAAPPHDGQRLARAVLGLGLRPPTTADRRRLALGELTGLVITDVDPRGPADRAGLRPDDVLVQLGRHRVGDLDKLALLLSQVRQSVTTEIYVVRNGQLGRATLRLRAPD